ncbi:PREDICTED: RING finger and SPRY domain-containing protein 1-like [Acropora digitifera]|uniref:RING finger and SPRY domain-containing protein 1-like n=1 Tax=Acropora digitifera TaxID=70779 RepID=UPI00077B25A5|nr:PREDICTED: RING finger and SPRY domain-containing protein 1-like [Acropora digitifera]
MGSSCCKAHEPLQENDYVSEHGRTTTSSVANNTDRLVLDALRAVRKLAGNNVEPPECMMILHSLAEEEEGWLNVVRSCIFAIPLEDALGAAFVCLILDECPLPTKDAIQTLSSRLNLSKNLKKLVFHTDQGKRESVLTPSICRNLGVVLACLADKLAGPLSIVLLTEGTLEFLIQRLVKNCFKLILILVTVIAQIITDCKTIFVLLLTLCGHMFTVPCKDRPYSYETEDLRRINVMLNNNDVSDYLKISPSGLEVSYITVCFAMHKTIMCDSFQEGYGIGDDEYSYAYDGCRQLTWHCALSTAHHHPTWVPGDVLGLLLDLEKGLVIFSLNGSEIEKDFKVAHSGAGFFAGASFMSFQHCIFNFGAQPFKFPPKVPFMNFNDHAKMTAEDKIILPRHLKLAAIRQESITCSDPCKICFENAADTRLEPCKHRDVCMSCALQLEDCPMCRRHIENRVETPSQDTS